jgi:preprotein translocase subunit SecF
MQQHIRDGLKRIGIMIGDGKEKEKENEDSKIVIKTASPQELEKIKTQIRDLMALLQEAQTQVTSQKAVDPQDIYKKNNEAAAVEMEQFMTKVDDIVHEHFRSFTKKQHDLEIQIESLYSQSSFSAEVIAVVLALVTISIQLYLNLKEDNSPALPFRA